jgi:outer membrane protein assembly factor BamB
MAGRDAILIGIRGTVLALDPASGDELWRITLKGADFVNVTLLDGRILAATKGELFALDPATGQILWQNKLQGLGLGFVTIAGAAQVPAIARRKKQDADAAGAGAAAVIIASS